MGKQSLKCRLGFHKWRPLGIMSLVMPSTFSYCARCMCGREVTPHGTWRYSPDAVKEALINDMREHGAEIAP